MTEVKQTHAGALITAVVDPDRTHGSLRFA
jgi:hypothetical protein